MRCNKCLAFKEAVYYESYDPHEEECCMILDIENDERVNENDKCELGCTLHYKTINKMLKEIK